MSSTRIIPYNHQAVIQIPKSCSTPYYIYSGKMASRSVIVSEHAPSNPLFSQAIVCNGMMYVSGNIGFDTEAGTLVQGTIGDRTVCLIDLQVSNGAKTSAL